MSLEIKQTKIQKIEERLGLKEVDVEDFWRLCSNLNFNSSKGEIPDWRRIGMIWYRLAGYRQREAAEVFKRDTSTVAAAEEFILTALDYPKSNKKLISRLEKLINFAQTEKDISLKQFTNSIHLENDLHHRSSNFVTTLFPCKD